MKSISTTLITELTRHVVLATLIGYIISERCGGLKRKMFDMSDGEKLGQLLSSSTIQC
jgi:hypothetical protein